ncbi:MAG: hypothetical protein AAFR16_14565 [Pseudomonadota bacterium]
MTEETPGGQGPRAGAAVRSAIDAGVRRAIAEIMPHIKAEAGQAMTAAAEQAAGEIRRQAEEAAKANALALREIHQVRAEAQTALEEARAMLAQHAAELDSLADLAGEDVDLEIPAPPEAATVAHVYPSIVENGADHARLMDMIVTTYRLAAALDEDVRAAGLRQAEAMTAEEGHAALRAEMDGGTNGAGAAATAT